MELDPSESDEDRDAMAWDDEEESALETLRGMPLSASSMIPNGDLTKVGRGHMRQRYQGVVQNDDGTMSLTDEQCTVDFHRVPVELRFMEQCMKDPETHAETVRMIHDMCRHANDKPLPETREDESDGDGISF